MINSLLRKSYLLSKIRAGRVAQVSPTGLKWEFCRKSKGTYRYVFCNADEGEPNF